MMLSYIESVNHLPQMKKFVIHTFFKDIKYKDKITLKNVYRWLIHEQQWLFKKDSKVKETNDPASVLLISIRLIWADKCFSSGWKRLMEKWKVSFFGRGKGWILLERLNFNLGALTAPSNNYCCYFYKSISLWNKLGNFWLSLNETSILPGLMGHLRQGVLLKKCCAESLKWQLPLRKITEPDSCGRAAEQ